MSLHTFMANNLYDLQDNLLRHVYTDLRADVNKVYLKLAEISGLTSPFNALSTIQWQCRVNST